MTNVLKIVLQKGEERLACIITAYYEISVGEDMIMKAMDQDHFEWLQFLWAFHKNYIGARHKNGFLITY